MAALGLGLLAAVCAGSADFLGGFASRRMPAVGVLLLVYLVGLVLAVCVASIVGGPVPASDTLLAGIAAGAMSGLGLFCLYSGLAIGPMTVVAPISATAAVVAVGVGLLSGDRPDASQMIGIGFAISGAVLVSAVSDRDSDSGNARIALLLAVGAAVALGIGFVAIRATSHGDPVWGLTAVRIGGVAAFVCIAATTRRDRFRPVGVDWVLISGIVAADSLALIAQLEAYRHGSLSIVSTLVSLYPVATVLLAQAVLHERVRPAQGAGIAAALLGVALIGVG